ncbi:hypothetical protein [Flaviaesturariibacter amylovorans]|uniref:T9SS type A sorting domain-containing protein n=1 Tax=Flaviaesturariibacter amylovorans TaxID=1084520 RepID=A0ABP8GAB3_9BACT
MSGVSVRLLALCLCLLGVIPARTQVSVSATAGAGGPTSYPKLSAAFDAINAGTHRGVITVTITSSYTETVMARLGASGSGPAQYSSVQVQPATGGNITVTSDLTGPMIRLDGAKNVTIDGRNPTTEEPGCTFMNTRQFGDSYVIEFTNGASQNLVRYCTLRGSVGVVYMGYTNTGNGNNFNTIEHCRIGNAGAYPYTCISSAGDQTAVNTGNRYLNNQIYNFSQYGYYEGNFSPTGASLNTVLEGNEFFMEGTPPAVSNEIAAIHIDNLAYNVTISRNYIHDLKAPAVPGPATTLAGIQLVGVDLIRVTNNMIVLESETAPSVAGIQQYSMFTTGIKINYNTVLIRGTATVPTSSVAFYRSLNATSHDTVRNNIFVNTRVAPLNAGLYQSALVLPAAAGGLLPIHSDYNILYSSGNAGNVLGVLQGSGGSANVSTTLAGWTAAANQDQHSLQALPVFVSNTDLHLQPAANAAIGNRGIPVPDIGTDYDGTARHPSTPDIGADEFSPPVVTSLVHPESPVSVRLSPNPVSEEAWLHVQSRKAGTMYWTLTDASGRTVLRFRQALPAGTYTEALHLGWLPAGIYQLAAVMGAERVAQIRFIKK